jgi:hypothetical protein
MMPPELAPFAYNETIAQDNMPLTKEEALARGFRWEEIVEVRSAGRGMVATIYCKDQCYAAGNEPGRWIWTHNGFGPDGQFPIEKL